MHKNNKFSQLTKTMVTLQLTFYCKWTAQEIFKYAHFSKLSQLGKKQGFCVQLYYVVAM